MAPRSLIGVLREVFYDGLDAQGWAQLLAAFHGCADPESWQVGYNYLEEHLARQERDPSQHPWGLWRMTSLRRDDRFESGADCVHEDRWDSGAGWEARQDLRLCLLFLSPEGRFRDDALRSTWITSSWADRDGEPHSRDPDVQRYFKGVFYTQELDRQAKPDTDSDGFLPLPSLPEPAPRGECLLYEQARGRGPEAWDSITWDRGGLSRERRLRARFSQTRYMASYELVCSLR